MDASEGDEEAEVVFLNRKDEGFIIMNSDLRKLYSMRPQAIKDMIFAQFIACYYKLHSGQKAVFQPQSDIGFDSNETIIGSTSRVPLYIKLTNGIKMKKRAAISRTVPLLLFSNSLDSYEDRILFNPWRNIEDVDEEGTEEDRVQQRQNRLSLFPLGVFQNTDRP